MSTVEFRVASLHWAVTWYLFVAGRIGASGAKGVECSRSVEASHCSSVYGRIWPLGGVLQWCLNRSLDGVGVELVRVFILVARWQCVCIIIRVSVFIAGWRCCVDSVRISISVARWRFSCIIMV